MRVRWKEVRKKKKMSNKGRNNKEEKKITKG